ncbi:hypothetical protein HYPSUDRAFT_207684 [Hypholoma sublateritium FD-334 SS-4]|uniref:Uncharacterized protein n=1 Tax=Hypholoma sublateritium (strain FD-334 SS-4) TaxID=945553 RepID=A0A0D2N9A8_HYPSF|nr:hypothetical protein HYPSUDRAFT_207684 [Hypholoma sublateritium FD-334 SS-4]
MSAGVTPPIHAAPKAADDIKHAEPESRTSQMVGEWSSNPILTPFFRPRRIRITNCQTCRLSPLEALVSFIRRPNSRRSPSSDTPLLLELQWDVTEDPGLHIVGTKWEPNRLSCPRIVNGTSFLSNLVPSPSADRRADTEFPHSAVSKRQALCIGTVVDDGSTLSSEWSCRSNNRWQNFMVVGLSVSAGSSEP